MKIYGVEYDFRWDYVYVTLLAENELDARQKADHYIFSKSRYKTQTELRRFEVHELVPDENGILDAEHSSHD